MKIKTVFLDRDGVLNVDNPEYTTTLEGAVLYKDVPEALRCLTEAGITVIVISNQACVSKGIISEAFAHEIFLKIIHDAESAGGKILDYDFCPHTSEDHCGCRKPSTRMFEKMAKKHSLDMTEAVFVGDGYRDYQAAEKLGIPFYLVHQGWGPVTAEKLKNERKPFRLVGNLQEAVNLILESSL